jgi:DNA-binding winged helix-turn-helix (wHTH) protein
MSNKFVFGRFELDFERGSLLNDQREVPLQTKAFELLAYLAREPRQWRPLAEAGEAVWPGLLVDDATLQAVLSELRRALDDPQGRVICFDAERGLRLDTAESPPERRRGRGAPALRFRWKYGLLAPLLMAAAFAAIWVVTARMASNDVAAAQRPTLAVLPFQNQSDDAALELRADQFTRELIALLAREASRWRSRAKSRAC